MGLELYSQSSEAKKPKDPQEYPGGWGAPSSPVRPKAWPAYIISVRPTNEGGPQPRSAGNCWQPEERCWLAEPPLQGGSSPLEILCHFSSKRQPWAANLTFDALQFRVTWVWLYWGQFVPWGANHAQYPIPHSLPVGSETVHSKLMLAVAITDTQTASENDLRCRLPERAKHRTLSVRRKTQPRKMENRCHDGSGSL